MSTFTPYTKGRSESYGKYGGGRYFILYKKLENQQIIKITDPEVK